MKKLDWNEYHGLVDQLANQIIEVNNGEVPYKHLFGVDTNSLICAAHLSNRLNVPLVTDISLLVYLLNMGVDENDTLLVSNVIKTGETFKEIHKQCNSTLDTAVLIKDSGCEIVPTYFVSVPDRYIILPWENK